MTEKLNVKMRKPDFFIVGAPKCGTTALYDYLKQHEEIFMPEHKEPHFFGSDLRRSFGVHDKKKYLSLFAGAKEEKRLGEASTGYLCSRQAATEIKRFDPTASVIIMLRNPVDMIYALHSERVYQGTEEISDFEAALEADRNGRQKFRCGGLSYHETGLYSEQVQRYLDVFGRDKVKIIIFDDFKADALQSYKETCEFLGVNAEFVPQIRVVNPNKKLRSMRLKRFTYAPSSGAPKVIKALVPTRVRRGAVWKLTTFLNRLNTTREPRPPMSGELRRRLRREFAADVERLGEIINRDLSHWTEC